MSVSRYHDIKGTLFHHWISLHLLMHWFLAFCLVLHCFITLPKDCGKCLGFLVLLFILDAQVAISSPLQLFRLSSICWESWNLEGCFLICCTGHITFQPNCLPTHSATAFVVLTNPSAWSVLHAAVWHSKIPPTATTSLAISVVVAPSLPFVCTFFISCFPLHRGA